MALTNASGSGVAPIIGGPLAPYAVSAANSRGRRHPETAPRWRSEFQRDRDRIVHCSAFRRLEYKTQVFVNHEGDMFRTRLTHSLEVSQIARTVARALRLNEDLTEAIALAHDLGHTPFGHAGQTALNDCMREYGGFEHNFHSLRVVDELEARYPDFRGLNLLFETREGILKHCSAARAQRLGDLGERFLARRQPSVEAQIANVADEIAYNHHDIDDGIRSGLLLPEQLEQLPLYAETCAGVARRWPALDIKRSRYTVIREMLNYFVSDLIAATSRRLEVHAFAGLEAVRAATTPMVEFGPVARSAHLALKRFLRHNLYEHPRVTAMAARSQEIIRSLFAHFMANPEAVPGGSAAEDPSARAQAVADYIAGMTDRYAISVHEQVAVD